jgi:Ala-tRNA(Pro) deacylase
VGSARIAQTPERVVDIASQFVLFKARIAGTQVGPGELVVRMVSMVAELLRRERMPHTAFRHPPAYSAQKGAAASHIPGRCWAKVVICIADGQPTQAVLPAHYTVDLEQLRELAGAATLRVAREAEVAELYPECEVGAMPPFGTVYGHRMFVDRRLVGEPEMVFNAGTHTSAFCMHYWDFAELTKPVVGTFGLGPDRRDRVPRSRPRRGSTRTDLPPES